MWNYRNAGIKGPCEIALFFSCEMFMQIQSNNFRQKQNKHFVIFRYYAGYVVSSLAGMVIHVIAWCITAVYLYLYAQGILDSLMLGVHHNLKVG